MSQYNLYHMLTSPHPTIPSPIPPSSHLSFPPLPRHVLFHLYPPPPRVRCITSQCACCAMHRRATTDSSPTVSALEQMPHLSARQMPQGSASRPHSTTTPWSRSSTATGSIRRWTSPARRHSASWLPGWTVGTSTPDQKDTWCLHNKHIHYPLTLHVLLLRPYVLLVRSRTSLT